jgi:hypothetical protein
VSSTEEKLMNSPTPEVPQKSLPSKPVGDSQSKDLVEQESAESAQPAHTKAEFDADRIRSSIARLTTNSIDDLERLTSELEQLQDFLRSETERVQSEIGSVLAGIGIIIQTIAPWKTAGIASAQNTRANGRDKLKRWPS